MDIISIAAQSRGDYPPHVTLRERSLQPKGLALSILRFFAIAKSATAQNDMSNITYSPYAAKQTGLSSRSLV